MRNTLTTILLLAAFTCQKIATEDDDVESLKDLYRRDHGFRLGNELNNNGDEADGRGPFSITGNIGGVGAAGGAIGVGGGGGATGGGEFGGDATITIGVGGNVNENAGGLLTFLSGGKEGGGIVSLAESPIKILSGGAGGLESITKTVSGGGAAGEIGGGVVGNTNSIGKLSAGNPAGGIGISVDSLKTIGGEFGKLLTFISESGISGPVLPTVHYFVERVLSGGGVQGNTLSGIVPLESFNSISASVPPGIVIAPGVKNGLANFVKSFFSGIETFEDGFEGALDILIRVLSGAQTGPGFEQGLHSLLKSIKGGVNPGTSGSGSGSGITSPLDSLIVNIVDVLKGVGVDITSGGEIDWNEGFAEGFADLLESPLNLFIGNDDGVGGLLSVLNSLKTVSGERLADTVAGVIESPLNLARTFSGNFGLTLGGVVETVSSPLMISADIFTGGLESPNTIINTVSGNLNETLNGIVGIVSSPFTVINDIVGGPDSHRDDNLLGFFSGVNAALKISETIAAIFESPLEVIINDAGLLAPLESFKAISGAQLGESIEALMKSPLTTVESLSGGVALTIGAVLATVSSPVSVSASLLTGGVQGIFNSPFDVIDTVSGNVQLALKGILQSVSSPLTLVENVLAVGQSVINVLPTNTNVQTISSGANLGVQISETLQAVLESPATIFVGVDGKGGILGILDSAKTISGDQLGRSLEAFVESPFLLGESLSGAVGSIAAGLIVTVASPLIISAQIATGGIHAGTRSPGAILEAISGNLDLTINGVLEAISSPLTLIAEIVGGGKSPAGVVPLHTNLHTLSTDVDGTLKLAEQITALLASPLLIFVGESGILAELESLHLISGDIGAAITGVIESPIVLAEVISGSIGSLAAGILGTVSSPATISARILADGVVSVINSPAETVQLLSANVQLFVKGVLGAVSSPLTIVGNIVSKDESLRPGWPNSALKPDWSGFDAAFELSETITAFLASPIAICVGLDGHGGILSHLDSLPTFSGQITGGTIQALIESPFTLLESLSGGLGSTIGGILATVSSPATICVDILKAGFIGEINSPRDIIDAVSGNVEVVLNGVLETVSSPITLSTDIVGSRQSPHGTGHITSNVRQMSSGVDGALVVAEDLLAFIQSPATLFIGVNGTGGILEDLKSLKLACGEVFGGGIEGLIESPFAFVETFSGGLALTIGGLLATASSPVTLSSNVLTGGSPGVITLPLKVFQLLSGNLQVIAEGIVDTATSPWVFVQRVTAGLVSINGVGSNLQTLSNDIDLGVNVSHSVLNFVESPIKFVFGDHGQGGLLSELHSLRKISGDFAGGIVETVVESPLTTITTLSGTVGGIVAGIVGFVASPLAVSGLIADEGINGLVKSPGVLLKGVSGDLDLAISGVLGTVSLPLFLSSQILNGPIGVTGRELSGDGLNFCSSIDLGVDLSEHLGAVLESPIRFLIGVNGEGGVLSHIDSVKKISGEFIGGGIEALIESPVGTLATFSTGLGMAIGGIVGLVSSPVSLCGEVLHDGIEGVIESPPIILGTASNNLNLAVKGILGTVSSPFAVCGDILDGDFDIGHLGLGANSNLLLSTLIESPQVLLLPLSGGVGKIVGGILEVVTSPLQLLADVMAHGISGPQSILIDAGQSLSAGLLLGVNGLVSIVSSPIIPIIDILYPTNVGGVGGVLHDSLRSGVSAIVESPRETLGVLSGSVGLTIAGILGAISSPVTISADIAEKGIGGFVASPIVALTTVSSNVGAAAGGILQAVSSPVTISAGINFGELIDFVADFKIVVPESLRGEVDTSFGSALKIVSVLCGNIDQSLDGILSVISSPLLVSGEILEHGIDSVSSSPLVLTDVLSGGLSEGVAGILNSVVSPITISALLVDGKITVDTNGHIIIDGGTDLTEIINAGVLGVFQSPQSVLTPLSAGLGLTLEGVLKTVSSPLTLSHEIVTAPNIITALANSPQIVRDSLIGDINLIIQGIVGTVSSPILVFLNIFKSLPQFSAHLTTTLGESPLLLFKTVSGSVDALLNGVVGVVSSPLKIFGNSGDVGGLLGLKSALDVSLAFIAAAGLALTGIVGLTSSPLVLSASLVGGLQLPGSPGPILPDSSPIHFPGVPGLPGSIGVPFSPGPHSFNLPFLPGSGALVPIFDSIHLPFSAPLPISGATQPGLPGSIGVPFSPGGPHSFNLPFLPGSGALVPIFDSIHLPFSPPLPISGSTSLPGEHGSAPHIFPWSGALPGPDSIQIPFSPGTIPGPGTHGSGSGEFPSIPGSPNLGHEIPSINVFPFGSIIFPPISGFIAGPTCDIINLSLLPVNVLSGLNCHCELPV